MTVKDLLCFSHLRWDFVFQRPNHLMTRCSKTRRVVFIEEPVLGASHHYLEQTVIQPNLWRIVPHLRGDQTLRQQAPIVAQLLRAFCQEQQITQPDHWFYTPMMLPFSEGLPRASVVYDCMDELSNFLNAPSDLPQLEERLLKDAHVVFTGGMALYEAKRGKHSNIYPMPSSVDADFFRTARRVTTEPEDQAGISGPRIGYCGVIDERLDLALIDTLAVRCPSAQIILVGPVVKIAPSALPRRSNIHYLGGKAYAQLPSYLGYWDVAMMPFALNDATRFISPTKTPEYLAAGRPVVSTPIKDVVEPYERLGLVRIGRDHESFIGHVEAILRGEETCSDAQRDAFLAQTSWDATWARMDDLLREHERELAEQRTKTRTIVRPKMGGLHV
jgi:UDP-galactopyranose mutase